MAKQIDVQAKLAKLQAEHPDMPPCKQFKHLTDQEVIENCQYQFDRRDKNPAIDNSNIKQLCSMHIGELRKRGLTCPAIPA